MAYANYAFYISTFKGNAINESDFDRLALRASTYLDDMTDGGIISPPSSNIQMAVCAVAEAWQTNEQGGDLASQSVGGWSKSFQTKPLSNEERLYKAAYPYINSLITRWL